MDTATLIRPGWYYVGDGGLRFHDEEDWTEHVLLAEEIRGHDWPPPDPRTIADKVQMAFVEQPVSRQSRSWVRRILQGAA